MNNKNKKHSGIKKSGDKVFRMPLISTKLAVSIFVTLVIIIVIIVIANLDYKVTSESLMGLSEFALTFIFTLAGLAFTIISIKPEIKQSDKNTFEINLNNYIISAFLAMMTVLFIYIYALFGVVGESNYMFIVLAIISMIFIFSRTWVLLTASYNIDGQNPN